MTEKGKKMWVTVICWKCDQKFKFAASDITDPQPVYFDDRGVELVRFLIRPRAYVVPCPNPDCDAKNEVTLP